MNSRSGNGRVLALVFSVALSFGCQRSEEGKKAEAQWPRYHEGRGRVVLVNPVRNRLWIDHEAIPTIPMHAMTMSYEVRPPELLEGIHEGDSVRFRLKETQKDLLIVAVEKEAPP